MKAVFALLVSALLAGCAAPPMYQWGGYDQALYAGYKDPAKMQELRTKLEAHVAAVEHGKGKVPPGLYAELGTLYLQAGSTPRAIQLYRMEQQAWPESSVLMNSLIRTLEKQASSEGVAK
jgi:hypothetical protein